jgi:hypothetical protein
VSKVVPVKVSATVFLDPDEVAAIIADHFARQGTPVDGVLHAVMNVEVGKKRLYKSAPPMGVNNSPFFAYAGASVHFDPTGFATRFETTIPGSDVVPVADDTPEAPQ